MFLHHEDVQAASSLPAPRTEIIRKHLMALQEFADEEVLAASEGLEAGPSGVKGEDENSNASSSDSDESMEAENDSMDVPLAQTLTQLRRRTEEASAQTGGIREAGRLIKRPKPPKPEPSLGAQVSKLRILLPLFKGLELK